MGPPQILSQGSALPFAASARPVPIVITTPIRRGQGTTTNYRQSNHARNINKYQVHLELASWRFVHHESDTSEVKLLRDGF